MFGECKSDEVVSATLITGPSGSGKSRLLAEFLARIEADERVCVLRARASHSEHDVPSSLLRRLQSMTPQLDSPTNCPEAALERAWSAGPVVVGIDDAQDADLESMRVLAASMTEHAEHPFLVVGAARSGMRAALRRIWQSIGARELPLRPLSVRTAERYAHAMVPAAQEPHAEQGREIALAEGNPRLLHAVVSAGRNQGGARLDATLALLAEKLIAVPRTELSVLCAASVFADPFGLSAVRAVVESDSGVARDLTTLCERKLLVESPASRPVAETEFRFAHPFIHEAAYRCMSAAGRARIRERAAQCRSRAKLGAHTPSLRD
jgi:energy-coupling factor transporter ATP-binding protein EcfA2